MLKKIKHNIYSEVPYKPSIILLFSQIGITICASMGLLGLYQKNYVLAATLFFASFIYFLGFYICKNHNNIRLSSAIILYSLYLLMFYLVFTGGVAQTGPLWIYIVAPVSLSIHGLKRGLFDIAVFITLIIVIMFLPIENGSHAIYPTEFKLRLIYSFLTVTFLSALYEYTRDHALKKTLELSHKYQMLLDDYDFSEFLISSTSTDKDIELMLESFVKLNEIDRNKLAITLQKLNNKLINKSALIDYQTLLKTIKNKDYKKIILPELGNRRVIDIETIIAIEADGAYSKIYLTDNKLITTSKNLKFFEEMSSKEKTSYYLGKIFIYLKGN